jgi:hypothetical protein
VQVTVFQLDHIHEFTYANASLPVKNGILLQEKLFIHLQQLRENYILINVNLILV